MVKLLEFGGHQARNRYTARQDKLGGIQELRFALSHMLQKGSERSRYCGCMALSYLLHGHQTNIHLFGETPGIFEGIREALSSFKCQGLACSAISQLAIGHTGNGTRICDTPDLVENLVRILQTAIASTSRRRRAP